MATYFRTAPQLVASGTISGNAGLMNNVLYTVPANTVAFVEMFRFRHTLGFNDVYALDVAVTTASAFTVYAATANPRTVTVSDWRPAVSVKTKSNTGLFFEIDATKAPTINSFFNAGEVARGLVQRFDAPGTITIFYDYKVWLFGG